MIDVSPEFLAALRTPQNLARRATAYPPGGAAVDFEFVSGTVTDDRYAAIRRRLDLTVIDPAMLPSSSTSPINVYGTEIQVWRGLAFANQQQELCSKGIFRIEDIDTTIPGGAIGITGWDRSIQVQDERFLKPRKLAGMTAIALIELLITEVYPSAAFDVRTSDATTIPKHVVDRDRLGEVQRVAQVIGCEVFPDATGRWVIQDVPDPAAAAFVWTVDAGPDGVMVGASPKTSRTGAPNTVVASGDGTGGNQAPVYGIAQDNDPLSPTWVGGSYGVVPRFFSSPHLRTQAQADRVAAAQLADHVGVSRTVDLDQVPNPALEAGDAIQIIYPDGSKEQHLIDSMTTPLTASGGQSLSTRAVDWTAD